MGARYLTLIRHAKSSWDYPQLTDKDRPLSSRGQKDVPLMARRNRPFIESIEQFYCSTALRAMETYELIQGELSGFEGQWQATEQLYTFSAEDLLDFCHRMPDQLHSICLVGHNPEMTELINLITPDQIANLPTCGIARIRLKIDSWENMQYEMGKLVYYTCPKNYR